MAGDGFKLSAEKVKELEKYFEDVGETGEPFTLEEIAGSSQVAINTVRKYRSDWQKRKAAQEQEVASAVKQDPLEAFEDMLTSIPGLQTSKIDYAMKQVRLNPVRLSNPQKVWALLTGILGLKTEYATNVMEGLFPGQDVGIQGPQPWGFTQGAGAPAASQGPYQQGYPPPPGYPPPGYPQPGYPPYGYPPPQTGITARDVEDIIRRVLPQGREEAVPEIAYDETEEPVLNNGVPVKDDQGQILRRIVRRPALAPSGTQDAFLLKMMDMQREDSRRHQEMMLQILLQKPKEDGTSPALAAMQAQMEADRARREEADKFTERMDRERKEATEKLERERKEATEKAELQRREAERDRKEIEEKKEKEIKEEKDKAERERRDSFGLQLQLAKVPRGTDPDVEIMRDGMSNLTKGFERASEKQDKRMDRLEKVGMQFLKPADTSKPVPLQQDDLERMVGRMDDITASESENDAEHLKGIEGIRQLAEPSASAAPAEDVAPSAPIESEPSETAPEVPAPDASVPTKVKAVKPKKTVPTA